MNTTLYALLPRRLMSRGMGALARIETPWLKNFIIKSYMRITGARTDFAAEKNPYAYKNLNAFFTRALAPGARPIDRGEKSIVSPVDGRCAIFGAVEADTLLQAKGMPYSVRALLGGDDFAQHFAQGIAATLYLAPDDYHRIHMPCDGTLRAMRFCPGDRHSVAPALLAKIPQLFAHNERAVCLFDTPFGAMALVLVGALNVSSIATVWAGVLKAGPNNDYSYREMPQCFAKGEEIARFELGSTVICFFERARVEWLASRLASGEKIHMGQSIARGLR